MGSHDGFLGETSLIHARLMVKKEKKRKRKKNLCALDTQERREQ